MFDNDLDVAPHLHMHIFIIAFLLFKNEFWNFHWDLCIHLHNSEDVEIIWLYLDVHMFMVESNAFALSILNKGFHAGKLFVLDLEMRVRDCVCEHIDVWCVQKNLLQREYRVLFDNRQWQPFNFHLPLTT